MNMRSVCLLASSLVLLAACAAAPLEQRPAFSDRDLDDMRAVLKRDFHARGIATMARAEPDALMRACNQYSDNPPAELAKSLEAEQMKTIRFPSDNLVGDWARGRKIAQSGVGMTWSDKPGVENGGSCYNCHQLSPDEMSYGTLGPSLLAFGKLRGYGAEIQRYAYGKIYNAKAYNACSQMPRMGHSGTLTEQQIKDLVAYLMDPASPVNR